MRGGGGGGGYRCVGGVSSGLVGFAPALLILHACMLWTLACTMQSVYEVQYWLPRPDNIRQFNTSSMAVYTLPTLTLRKT